MIRQFVVLALFVVSSLSAAPLLLKNQLIDAHSGDFVVTAQGKMRTLFLIRSIDNQLLHIEEVSLPEGKAPEWKKWIKNGALNHTSWVSYTIDLTHGKVSDRYSFPHGCFREKAPDSQLFATLLHLPFKKVSDRRRKKIGARTMHNRDNPTLFWQPRLFSNGEKVSGALFDAWEAYWPQDQSDLAGKKVTIYLPQKKGEYPSYLPYWLEVAVISKPHLRIVDSGKGIESPKPSFEQLERTKK